MEKDLKYPIDLASFKRIREEDYVYVDKTEFIHTITKKGAYYFLARPRRFGKSLFLDTLAQYFCGNRELFKGLAIDKLQPEDWKPYPVLRFNMSGVSFLNPESLINHISHQLEIQEKEYGRENSEKTIEARFFDLITHCHAKTSEKVVILIDEYDAPLSSTIDKIELQHIYREQLHGFYSVLKNSEEHIRFCMLTGVTRYGKLSVFSGLNNLNDISFDNDYAGVCGVTKDELEIYYHNGVYSLASKFGYSVEETYHILKDYYDGYHFSNELLDLYNPFSLNYIFEKKEFKDYWCQSGVPTILAKSVMQNDYNVEKLVGLKVQESELRDLSLYVDNPVPLFYQTGYLTLKNYDSNRNRYTLGYPNKEVELGILRNILNYYNPGAQGRQNTIFDLEDALEDGNPELFIKVLSSFLADIPSELRKNVAKYENYYHTIFYCIVKLIGLDIDAEYNTSEGFIDILIKTTKYIYIIELKVNGSAEDAIKQINEKHYCNPFVTDSRRIYRIGIGFSKKRGSILSSIIDSSPICARTDKS